jgi:hypothetical protein
MSEGETIPAMPPRKLKFKKIFLSLVAFIVVAVVAEQVWYHYTYPYGWSHACSKGLGLGLRSYAEDHEHWLPHGEATPEASLSLLYKYDTNVALWVLPGKNIRREFVETTLKRDGKLSPETCGWHYVEGLRDDDDLQIAVAWDKVVGLGHNGQRWPRYMHEIVHLDGSTEFIEKNQWHEFIANQKNLLAHVVALRASNAPPIRWSDEEDLGPNRFSPR